MTSPDILAAAREAVALDAFVDESACGDPALFASRIQSLGVHADTHYAAIAAALLAAEAEGEQLRAERDAAVQRMKAMNATLKAEAARREHPTAEPEE